MFVARDVFAAADRDSDGGAVRISCGRVISCCGIEIGRQARRLRLLTAAEIAKLLENAGDAKPGLTGGVPNCQWASPDGAYVQVIGVEASE